MHYIYKIFCDVTGKVYIGQTSKSIETRFNQHMAGYTVKDRQHLPLYKDVAKYGREHFHLSLLHQYEDIEDANISEQYLILRYHAHQPEFGYNTALGGENYRYVPKRSVCQLAFPSCKIVHAYNNVSVAGKWHRIHPAYITLACLEPGTIFNSHLWCFGTDYPQYIKQLKAKQAGDVVEPNFQFHQLDLEGYGLPYYHRPQFV